MLESQLILGWSRQGEDKGEVKAGKKFVLNLIRRRFSDPVPEDLLDAMDDSVSAMRKAIKSTPSS
jgi:hypothetical protein